MVGFAWGPSGGNGLGSGSTDFKASVRAATTAALAANTYDNGASGVGATLTANANGALAAVDGVTLVAGNRLLVKNEVTGANNGIYVVTQVGTAGTPYILTRASDADTNAEVTAGMIVPVEEGTVNADQAFILTTNNPITLGTTALTFAQYSGMYIGGVVGSGTTGSVLFVGAASALAQDNANFFWDDTNNRLGINIAGAPDEELTLGTGGVLKVYRSDNTRATTLKVDADGTKLSSDATGNDPLWLNPLGTSSYVGFQIGTNNTNDVYAKLSRTGLVITGTGAVAITPTHSITLTSTATGMTLYNTADQTTNFERVREYWSSNVFTILSEKGGSGTLRSINIGNSTLSLTISGTAISHNSTTLMTTTATLTNGAGVGAGTITNAPAAGNPTKWVPINDNGTTRYLPAW